MGRKNCGSSLSGVKALLKHFKGGLNFKNPPKIKKYISLVIH